MTPKLVLIALSDALEARELLDSLTSGGYEVIHGESGEEALQILFEEMAKGKMPSLALIDADLPGISGLGVLERIRKLSTLSSCPVIILTSSEGIGEIRSQALQGGAWGVALRPLDPNRIVGTVRSLIAGHIPRSRTIAKDVYEAEYNDAVDDMKQKRIKKLSPDP